MLNRFSFLLLPSSRRRAADCEPTNSPLPAGVTAVWELDKAYREDHPHTRAHPKSAGSPASTSTSPKKWTTPTGSFGGDDSVLVPTLCVGTLGSNR